MRTKRLLLWSHTCLFLTSIGERKITVLFPSIRTTMQLNWTFCDNSEDFLTSLEHLDYFPSHFPTIFFHNRLVEKRRDGLTDGPKNGQTLFRDTWTHLKSVSVLSTKDIIYNIGLASFSSPLSYVRASFQCRKGVGVSFQRFVVSRMQMTSKNEQSKRCNWVLFQWVLEAGWQRGESLAGTITEFQPIFQ